MRGGRTVVVEPHRHQGNISSLSGVTFHQLKKFDTLLSYFLVSA